MGDGGRNPEVDFHGERRSNTTYESATDPESRLAKRGKGKEAKLCFGANVLMDNWEGLIVDVRLTPADGTWERDAAIEMLSGEVGGRRITVRGRPGLRHQAFRGAMPPTGGDAPRGSEEAFGHRRTDTRHEGYRLSQRARKRV